jgi:1-acyl-sn-glycerol-3-phosphate acyltransferase
MNVVMLTLRTLLFYLGYLVFVAVFSLLSCTIGLLLPLRQRQTLATCGNYLILHWLHLCCGIRLVVRGRENLPTGPFVVLSNHQSPWETYYLQRTLRPVSTILKKELLKIPVFGWGLASVKPIAIDREHPRQAIKAVMEQGKQRLAMGINVIVYPEGTRLDHGQYGQYARSGAALAAAAAVPIVPVAHNAGRCWPARRFLKHPGIITVVIGPPLDTSGGDSKALTTATQQWITARQQEIG